jgi:hypothetical protein
MVGGTDIWVVAIQSNNQLVFLKCEFPVLLEQLVYPGRNTREKSLPDVLAKALQHPASICTRIIKPHINFLVHLLYIRCTACTTFNVPVRVCTLCTSIIYSPITSLLLRELSYF